MPIETSEILSALQLGENADWEFKSAKGGIPSNLWDSYSAMANTEGGVIVLGISQKGEVFRVDGLDNPRKTLRDFWNLINNREKVSVNLLEDSDSRIQDIGGASVLVIHVPRASRRQRPVYVGQNPIGGTFKRNHEGDYRCTPDQVGRMLADQAEEPADSQIVPNIELGDFDADTISQFRQRFSARDPDHPWLSLETSPFLEKLGAWRRDRIIVEKHPDRLVFSNPGTLLISFDQLLMGGVSDCRNESLQKMFQLIGGGEKMGSGIDKIRAGWRSQHWRLPSFVTSNSPDRFICTMPMVSLLPERSLEILERHFGTDFRGLDQDSIQALVTAHVEGEVSNERLREITAKHPADLTKMLQRLVSDGYLEPLNRGRWTRYRLPSSLVDSSVGNGLSMVDNGPSIVDNGPSIVDNGPSMVDNEPDELEKLAGLARENKRLNPNEMSNLVLALCEERWLTVSQLASLLDRTRHTISSYVRPLLKQKKLQPKFPNRPRHPQQAYGNFKKP